MILPGYRLHWNDTWNFFSHHCQQIDSCTPSPHAKQNSHGSRWASGVAACGLLSWKKKDLGGLYLSDLPGPRAGQSLLSDPVHSASPGLVVFWRGAHSSHPRFTMSFQVRVLASTSHTALFPFRLLCLHSTSHENETCWLLGAFSTYCLSSGLRGDSNMYSVCTSTLWHTYTKIFTQCTCVHPHPLLPK